MVLNIVPYRLARAKNFIMFVDRHGTDDHVGGFAIAGRLLLPHDYGVPHTRLREALGGFATCARLLVEILNHGANGGMMQKWSTSWSKVNQHHIWRACKTNGRGLKRR